MSIKVSERKGGKTKPGGTAAYFKISTEEHPAHVFCELWRVGMKKPGTAQIRNRYMYEDLGHLHVHNQHECIKRYNFFM